MRHGTPRDRHTWRTFWLWYFEPKPFETAGGCRLYRLLGVRAFKRYLPTSGDLVSRAFGLSVSVPVLAAAQWAANAQARDQVEIARLSSADTRRNVAVSAAAAYLSHEGEACEPRRFGAAEAPRRQRPCAIYGRPKCPPARYDRPRSWELTGLANPARFATLSRREAR